MEQRHVKNRIREIRKSLKMSQEELGARMRSELTGSAIAKIEKGRIKLSLDYMQEIAGVLGVTPAELLEDGGPSVRMVPVIGMVAAGAWQEAVEMSEDAVPVPSDAGGPRLFALRPSGDSMDKLVPEGAEGGFVIVDPDDRELRNGKLYVMQNGEGETAFKKFCTDPLALLPCSNNPAHKAIPLGSEPFTVIGRVVFVGQEL